MRPTRRWWSIAAVGAVLLAISLVGDRFVPLVGASVLGAYCLVTAARAVSTITTADDSLTVDVDATPDRVPAGSETTVTVTATLDAPVDHPVTVDYTFPASVDAAPQSLTITPGERRAHATCAPSFPVAGRFSFPDLTVTYESPDGLFTQRVPRDEQVSVTAEAQGTGDIHVGAGGDTLRGMFGSHQEESQGTRGDDFADLREYQPTDSVRRIDWKTTARLDTPHVREYEAEREQLTRLVLDARSTLTAGDSARTKLDYLREVALSILRNTERADDPVALTIVDDNGIRTITDAASTVDHYRRLRETLLALGSEQQTRHRRTVTAETGPADAQAASTQLTARTGPLTTFELTLMPYFSRTGSYVAQVSADPLFTAVQQHVGEVSSGTWTVLLTDDTERGRVVETMKLATRGSHRATAFVTPSVLFEPRGVSDVESAYERLVDFEEFRKRLHRIPRANAYEVAPDGRLRAVLAQGSEQSRQQTRRRRSADD
ncbi:DUF58 domain-containing protein [Salinigranum halophilum]|uniref:DUF58 domain-containing protein n=1 Tax=Salinigranum halophilum TaxID=2565931 RepID=UPI001375C5FE|nr:DUF58 domain-containing protein [Salinigranum halophilum]